MLRHLVCYVTCLSAALLGGCQGYDLIFNEQVVYSPKPLFSDFEVPDKALRTCLGQAIVDNRVTAADMLAGLNCSSAGIADLQGLSVFTGLSTLHLSSNQIRNLVELGSLTNLEELNLSDNLVIDATPLTVLPGLRKLDLRNNNALQCPHTEQLRQVSLLLLPKHCKQPASPH